MGRKKLNKIRIEVQCHPNIVQEIRNYAKIESEEEQKRIERLQLSKKNHG